ncbi:FAD:protein FMN transferase [Streptomyces sp. PTM05]|uniref:FAD:protein FMN transferase n=1 Tax=Streptantibioticus parmotrematis TaxID=2873249 RepID=A0ABS7QVV3_9ACTN|nr:FAD:protein FMN transferase [Streptantibioticus parmotrematis]MBY8887043.1 FAD:protein FMN transferase [Streptantibioticus parmotrematis]
MTTAIRSAGVSFQALGTTATLLVTDSRALHKGHDLLKTELSAIDQACNRFRPDSELSRVNASSGRRVEVGALFAEALDTALRVADETAGTVDPTVGETVRALGYDQSFTALRPQDLRPLSPAAPPHTWRDVLWRRDSRLLILPAGVSLDLGATAKALAADRAARRIADVAHCGVLVNLGGDLAIGGEAPDEGWRIAVSDDHTKPKSSDPVVRLTAGGLATSGTVRRRWKRDGRVVHHIVNPSTGDVPPLVWRTVTVAAATCVEANAAATEAVVRGEAALDALRAKALPARLVRMEGAVVRVCGWPAETAGVE